MRPGPPPIKGGGTSDSKGIRTRQVGGTFIPKDPAKATWAEAAARLPKPAQKYPKPIAEQARRREQRVQKWPENTPGRPLGRGAGRRP